MSTLIDRTAIEETALNNGVNPSKSSKSA